MTRARITTTTTSSTSSISRPTSAACSLSGQLNAPDGFAFQYSDNQDLTFTIPANLGLPRLGISLPSLDISFHISVKIGIGYTIGGGFYVDTRQTSVKVATGTVKDGDQSTIKFGNFPTAMIGPFDLSARHDSHDENNNQDKQELLPITLAFASSFGVSLNDPAKTGQLTLSDAFAGKFDDLFAVDTSHLIPNVVLRVPFRAEVGESAQLPATRGRPRRDLGRRERARREV